MKKALFSLAGVFMAISFAQLCAEDVEFGPGLVTAESIADQLIPENSLITFTSGDWLHFDAASTGKTYTVSEIYFNDISGDAETSGIILEYGELNVLTDTTVASETDSKGTLTISGGSLITANGVMASGVNSTVELALSKAGLYSQATSLVIAGGRGSTATVSLADSAAMEVGSNPTSDYFRLGNGAESNSLISVSGNSQLNVYGWMGLGFGAGSHAAMEISENAEVSIGYYLNVGNSVNSNGTLTMSGGTLNTTGNLGIAAAQSVSGTVVMTDGTINVGGTYWGLGHDTGAAGVMTMSGGTVNASNATLVLGNSRNSETQSNSGLFNMSGGQVFVKNINMAMAANSTGSLLLSGGTITVNGNIVAGGTTSGTALIDVSGTGVLSVEGTGVINLGRANEASGILRLSGDGKVTTTGTITAGSSNFGSGKIELSGNSQLTAGNIVTLGHAPDSTGELSLADNAVFNVGSYMNVGSNVRSVGTVTMSGGTLSTAGNLVIGANQTASGTLLMTAGTININGGYFGFGHSTGASGIATVSGGTINGLNAGLSLGSNSTTSGIFAMSGGTLSVKTITLGAGANSTGTMTLSGGNVIATATLALGSGMNSTGLLSVEGGSIVNNSRVRLGNSTASQGAIQISSGSITFNETTMLGVGHNSTGTMTVSGGNADFSALLISNPSNGWKTNGMYVQTGGVVTAGSLGVGANNNLNTSTTNATVDITGGLLQVTNYVDVGSNIAEGSTTSARMTVSGTGKLTVSGTLSALRDGIITATSLNVGSNLAVQEGGVAAGKAFRSRYSGVGNFETVNVNGGGVYIADGGQINVSGLMTLGSTMAGDAVSSAAYVTSGTLSATQVQVNGGGLLQVSSTAKIGAAGASDGIVLDAGDNAGTAALTVNSGADLSILGSGNLELHTRAALTFGIAEGFNAINVGGQLIFAEGVSLGTQLVTLDFSSYTGPSGEIAIVCTDAGVTGFSEWYADVDANLVVTGLNEGYTFEGISLSADQNDLLITISGSWIPEPSSATWAIGLLVLAIACRRRR